MYDIMLRKMDCSYFSLGNRLKFVLGNSLQVMILEIPQFRCIVFVQLLACLDLSILLCCNFCMNREKISNNPLRIFPGTYDSPNRFAITVQSFVKRLGFFTALGGRGGLGVQTG